MIHMDEQDRHVYETLKREALIVCCRVKDITISHYKNRYRKAEKVIDLIAKFAGYNPNECGVWLYCPDGDGESTPIIRRMEELLRQAGEEVQLKKRVAELEQENALLRSLLAPGGR